MQTTPLEPRPTLLYLHQFFATPDSNVGTRSYEMARRLVARGFRVHMIASPTGSEQRTSDEVDGIEVHWIGVPYYSDMSYARRALAFVHFSILASLKVIRLRGDLIFATSTPLTIAIPALIGKWFKRLPMVFEVRDLWPELPIAIGALRSPLAIRAARALEHLAYHQSAHVIGLSPGMCEGIARTGIDKSRISLISNSCDLDRFDVSAEAASTFRMVRPWLGKRPLVLYAGSFGHINGVAWLAELAACMREIDPDVRFLALGDGHDRAIIERRATELGVVGESFFIEKRIAKREVPSAFAAASVCCSLFVPLKEMEHNSANKFFDALAAGKPVLINYGGWQRKLIQQRQIGLSVDPADPDDAARRLNELLQSPEVLLETGRRARALGRERFSRDQLAAELGDVLEKALPQHLRPRKIGNSGPGRR